MLAVFWDEKDFPEKQATINSAFFSKTHYFLKITLSYIYIYRERESERHRERERE